MAIRKHDSRTRGRRAAEKGSARDDILRSAIEIFAKHGFEGAKVAEIARRAGVRHPLVSYYFANKESLWEAALDQLWDELSGAFADAVVEFERLDPLERLRLLYRRYVLFSAKHPEIHRLVATESFSPGPRLNRLVDRYIAPLEETLLKLIKESTSTTDLDPLYVMVILNGAVVSFIGGAPLLARSQKFDPTEQARALEMADAVMDVVLHGVATNRDARVSA